jgi:amino-acid N-acetyltransferase
MLLLAVSSINKPTLVSAWVFRIASTTRSSSSSVKRRFSRTTLFSSHQSFRYSNDHVRLSAFRDQDGGAARGTKNQKKKKINRSFETRTFQSSNSNDAGLNGTSAATTRTTTMQGTYHTIAGANVTAEFNGEMVEIELEKQLEESLNLSSKNNNTAAPSKSISSISERLRQFEVPDGTVSVLSIDPTNVDIYQRNMTHVAQLEECPIVNVGEMFHNRHFVEMFRGSASYIASHRNSLVVFHIPGDLIDENPATFRDLMNDISLTWLLGMKVVIVAGCRYQIEKRLHDRNMHKGMVVTDPNTLRVVKEEAGYVRFEVERQLARALKGSRGGNVAEGGEGNVVSGNFFSSQPFGVLDGVDYMYSGFVRRMETDKIHQALKNKDIVLLTTLGFSPTGEVFNVNSEYLASYAGAALNASKLIYFLEKDVAMRHKLHGSNIPHLRVNDGKKLLQHSGVRTETKGFVYLDDCPYNDAEQNFLVKMGWGMDALKKGVKRVHLISPENGALLQELYTRDGAGTMISGDVYDGISAAKVGDVTAIHELISPLIEKGTLKERTKATLERDIDQYHVYTRDGLIVACGQLKMFENGYAEIGCLVVNAAYRAKGRGDAMLGYLERLCVQGGAKIVFVLSTQTMEWFIERGFDEVGVDMLPPSRQATYNHQRASKIYMKKINSVRDLDASELFWDR